MADNKPVIIIRKKKKGGDHGHHGGAWKVAYADFVTAMMAFFLLLWLLNVTTDIQRRGIADYFAPASISKSESGAGGIFAGESITSVSGAQISQYTPPSVDEVTVATAGQGEEGDEDTKNKSEHAGDGKTDMEGKGTGFADKDQKTGSEGAAPDATSAGAAEASPESTLSKADQAIVAAMQREEQAFKQAEEVLKQAILGSPEFRDFANQIVIDRTPEGLRIQIVDRDKFSMFPSGGATPYERARDLLRLVGKVVARLPNNISITGHTDSTPFQAGSSRDNWTLSTSRANTSRAELVAAGVDDQRVQRVVGLADRDPYVPADPKDPRNRRISIVLLRQAGAAEGSGNSSPPASIQDSGGSIQGH
ncbi:MAG: flagellar motor protein MotB [Bdellovibrionales bacterium]